MGYDEDKNALIEWRPAQNTVLSQGPVVSQCAFNVHKVAALAQTHLLGQARQLIEVRRIVRYSSYP